MRLVEHKIGLNKIDTVMHRNGCLVFMDCAHQCLPGVTTMTALLYTGIAMNYFAGGLSTAGEVKI